MSTAVEDVAESGPSALSRSTPPRVFSPTFSIPGLLLAGLFFAVSVQPSLLPRAGYVQGIAAGITMAIGYGIGAGGQALWNYLQIPKLPAKARRIGRWILVALIIWIVGFSAWRFVGWQNEIRTLFGMDSITFTVWPVIIGVGLLTFVLLLVVSRSLRLLFRTVFTRLGRRLPRRLAIVLGAGGLLLLFWLLISGLLVNGFFAVSNVMFSSRDGATTEGIVQPQSALRSGSPDSLVQWDELGRQGRSFVATGPTIEELDAFSGGGAQEPIRAYVGLKSAETLQERADLLLEELKRTGAFEREALVIATTTGTGFLDPNGVDPVEYIFNGDIAIAGVQYSYLPSWISLLADQAAVKETSTVVFNTIHSYWSTLPEDSRPDIYLYGLSLGSYGVESVLNSISIINDPISGAFMSGPPFVNDLHTEIATGREPGSPEWRPIYGDSRTVRFMAEEGFAVTEGEWGPTRLVYLQHGSDPVVFFSPSLAWQPPSWLDEGQRPPDVSERMVWFPLVTFWQVALDLPGAGNVPWGYGHMYSTRANTEGWVAVTDPAGWTPERTDELVSVLESQGYTGD
ncbi:MAG: hypothetical protein GC156_04225 [Actinomycetales bacterium]|nr:hypothetical protein [Actinomycetales bacterium]